MAALSRPSCCRSGAEVRLGGREERVEGFGAPSRLQRHADAWLSAGRQGAREAARCLCDFQRPKSRRSWVARTARPDVAEVVPYAWTGTDEFEALGDRQDRPPIPLPAIKHPKRVVLVRHGQSTWNAAGIIQGSSDISVLSEKGKTQAAVSGEMLQTERFDRVFVSPLARARETADIIRESLGARATYPTEVLPQLREIDLYDFQGLVKAEGKDRFGAEYLQWQKAPHDFMLGGRAPVRELWYRASLAWQRVLGGPAEERNVGVVAHNAVNQALICTALGMGPHMFRRLLQSNAAYSVLEFTPSEDPSAPPSVVLQRLNQSPDPPFKPGSAGRKSIARVVLVRHAATAGNERGLVMGTRTEPCSETGVAQAARVRALLADLPVRAVHTCDSEQCVSTSAAIQAGQGHHGPAEIEVVHEETLRNRGLGSWEGRPWAQVSDEGPAPDMEPMWQFWPRVGRAWDALLESAGRDGGRDVVAVTHSPVITGVVCRCLGLNPESIAQLRVDTGGVTIIEFPDGVDRPGVVRCLNYTAHLGDKWVIPAFGDDIDGVCGVDGCF